MNINIINSKRNEVQDVQNRIINGSVKSINKNLQDFFEIEDISTSTTRKGEERKTNIKKM